MKKNKMMRVASALLVAVLLTTCAISGTFAKYVTTVSGSDSARVATWNIGYNFAQISTFNKTYDSTVDSAEQVVAPGTSDFGTYILTGAPETDYKVTFNFTTQKEVFLGAHNYDYENEAYTGMDLNLASNYIPLTWKVTLTTPVDDADITAIGSGSCLSKGDGNTFATMSAMAAAINNTQISYDANEAAELTIKIEWSWAIGGDDKADTILGYLANDVDATNGMLKVDDPDQTLVADTDFCTNVGYTFSMTAEQVD
ncbi:MAG: hypothetical protein E7644_06660 [Ruminococcaceae bacterium]|nr:hypothetical protein [Oscillospiraceae bacterium]